MDGKQPSYLKALTLQSTKCRLGMWVENTSDSRVGGVGPGLQVQLCPQQTDDGRQAYRELTDR